MQTIFMGNSIGIIYRLCFCILPLLGLLGLHCGKSSKVSCYESQASSSCIAPSDDEKALQLLEEEKYEEAIALLQTLIATHHADAGKAKYIRHVRLASAYGSLAGFDINAIIEGLSSGNSSEQGLLSMEKDDSEEAPELERLSKTIPYLADALYWLNQVFANVSYPQADDDAATVKEQTYRKSGEFQQTIYSAIHVKNCNAIYTYVSKAPTERQAILKQSAFSSCGFTGMLENLDIFIDRFAKLMPDCTSCQTSLEAFKDKKSEFADLIKDLPADASESEKQDEIVRSLCKKKADPSLNCEL